MPYEDKNFCGSLVLDFREWWRHVFKNDVLGHLSSNDFFSWVFQNSPLQMLCRQN